ncbi:DUF5926 family protein [Corynebacterium sp. H78]|uniref:DUF5926 family protein n=1 Tax=Corynebacterium sp. H78 TaxID=3133417 RepID=UPI0030B6EC9A
MGKKSRKNRAHDVPEGMSRRQAKLAARAAERARLAGNPRPFEGFAAEADLVALREFAPSVVVPVKVTDSDRNIFLCTVLPGGIAALTREDKDGVTAFVAMQTQARSNDAAADLARALLWARDAEPGQQLTGATDGEAVELSGLLAGVSPDDIVVHQDFEWWLPEGIERTQLVEQNLRVANDSLLPSYRLDIDVAGAVWWIDPGERAHIRWVRLEKEAELLDALARVHAADHLTMGEGTKFAGVFRADGVLVPVWDLDNTKPYDSWNAAIADADKRIKDALAVTEPLTAEERKSRETIVSRQVTLR